MSERRYQDGILVYNADDVARTVTTYDSRGDLLETRPYTPEEIARADAEETLRTQTNNYAELTKTESLDGRLTRLGSYKTDPEITAALARPNNTAPTTQELNRLLKVMLRREERLTATIAMLVRLIDPALLANISDTADS